MIQRYKVYLTAGNVVDISADNWDFEVNRDDIATDALILTAMIRSRTSVGKIIFLLGGIAVAVFNREFIVGVTCSAPTPQNGPGG